MTILAPLLPDRIARTTRRVAPRLALFWLAFALLCQGLVVQTHAHGTGGRDWAGERSGATPTANDRQKQAPAAPACPLCEEKALFGAYLLAGSVSFTPPVEPIELYAATAPTPKVRLLWSHAWRSRAPPLFTT